MAPNGTDKKIILEVKVNARKIQRRSGNDGGDKVRGDQTQEVVCDVE